VTRAPASRLKPGAGARGLACAAGLALVAGGCARSAEFQRDQAYYGEYPQTYYSQPGSREAPSKRISMLGQPKKRLVVFNFWNDTPVQDSALGLFAADELRRGLFLSERVIIPTDARTDLETRDFVRGDNVKVAQLIREGRRLGVAAVVIGRITRVVFRQRGDEVGLLRQTQSMAAADVELKLFDVAGGREVVALGRSGEASSNAMVALEGGDLQSPQYRSEITRLALREAMTAIVPDVMKAMEKMEWEGRIAKVVGSKIYINAGRQSGIVAGDILKVLTPGDEVYDPESGAFLGRTSGQLKGTLEVVDFIGEDGAVASIHTGGQAVEGDVVRLY